jgi:signal transduction histidine kinase
VPFMRVIFVFTGLLILSLNIQAQIPAAFTEKLEASKTSQEFKQVIFTLVDEMRAGRLEIYSKDVRQILDITHTKDYANEVLPVVYGWLGTVFGDGQIDQAILYFLENASLYEKQGKHLEYSIICFEIALIQQRAKNYTEAEKYYERSLSYGKDSLDHRIIIGCYNGIALINRERALYNEATLEFKKALTIAQVNKDVAWIGILHGNIGSIFYRQENYDSSLYYYFKNLAFIKRVPEVENEIETYANIGKVYLKKKNYKLTRTYLDSAVQIITARKIRFSDFFNPMDEIYESYALLHAEAGNYAKAFEYYQKFYLATKEKQLQVDSKRLAQLQSAHEFKQKQTYVDLLEEVNAANETIIRQQNYALIAFIIVVFLLSSFAVLAYRISQQRKKLNARLNKANLDLERINQTKDKLFMVIGHDLKSPITNLSMMLMMLKSGDIKQEEFKGLLDKLQQQVESTKAIIHSLLQWAKTEMSGSTLQTEKIPVEYAARVLHQFSEETKKKAIRISAVLPEDLYVLADKDQLEIILRNIISNAIKFTNRTGSIHLTAQAAGSSTEIIIHDTGIGIAEEDMKNLFIPGRHTSKPGTENELGTGIGLFITREMIANNGGTITVKSEKGKGTDFIVSLPATIKKPSQKFREGLINM